MDQYVATEVEDTVLQTFQFAVLTVVAHLKHRFVVVLAAAQQDRPAAGLDAVQLALLVITTVFVVGQDMYHVVLVVCLKEQLVATVEGGVRLAQTVVKRPHTEIVRCHPYWELSQVGNFNFVKINSALQI